MNEAFLFLVILLLIGYIFYLQYRHEKQIQQLLNRIMAKSLDEVQKVEDSPNKVPTKEKQSPYVPISELTDEEFEKAISRTNKPKPEKTLMAQFREKISKKK